MRNPFRRGEAAPAQRVLDVGTLQGFIPPPGAEVVPGAMNVDGALRLVPVFAAGRLLASSVASLPLQVYRRNGEQRQKLPVPALFAAPSATGTLHDWLFRAMTSLIYRGNAVGLVRSRDSLEHPTRVEWLDPDKVSVDDTLTNLGQRGSYTNPIWRYFGIEIPAEDIVHIPWFTLPGRVWGLSPMAAYASTVRIGRAAQQFSVDWFDNGGVPPGTFRNEEQTVTPDEATVIKQRLLQSIRSREPIVYGKDWNYQPIAISPHEAQFVETMRLTATQIATIYGIPPEKIGGDTGAPMTYTNIEQNAIDFVRFTLLPWLTKLEDAFSVLLPRPQYVKFNVDALTRPDAETRYANYERARIIGLNNVDELRALEDEPPLPNGQGQDYTPLQTGARSSTHTAPPMRNDFSDEELRAPGTGLPPALLKYWVYGAGAQKIRWGVPDDFNRCIVNIQSEATKDGHPLPEHQIHGLCATLHKLATGATPGHAPGEHHNGLILLQGDQIR